MFSHDDEGARGLMRRRGNGSDHTCHLNIDPSENMNDTGDETLDLSAPLLLRSESDEGIKDWFEDDGYRPEDQVSSDNTVQYVEETLLVLLVSILNMLQWGFLVGAFFVPWIDTYIDGDATGYWNNNLVRVLTCLSGRTVY